MERARGREHSDLLISGHDRERALVRLHEAHGAGYLTDLELEDRAKAVGDATAEIHLKLALDGLPGPGQEVGALRASRAQRETAIRKLAAHHEQGRLSEVEHGRRISLVNSHAATPIEIAHALEGLPPLKPARAKRDERLVSGEERKAATRRLNALVVDGTLTSEEHAERVERVQAARSREEVAAAFDDLRKRDYQKLASDARDIAKVAGTQVFGIAAGALRGLLVAIWAIFSVVVAIIWVATGAGPVTPVLILGLLLLLLRVGLRIVPKPG